jgi:catechol 2,3-dioxygenase-like lactoylglutathione lyase family enzyme
MMGSPDTREIKMSNKPTILKVQHVQITIPKGAEDPARDFYCGILGLSEVAKPSALLGRGGFWLQIESVQVHVGTEDGITRADSKAHVAYEVIDLDVWREILQEAGVAILDGIPIPHYRRFEFRDPFGNRVEFLERT